MIKVSDSVTTLYYIEDAINDLLELAAQLASGEEKVLVLGLVTFSTPEKVSNVSLDLVPNDTVSN